MTMKIWFLHARDYSNAGDVASCPYGYFDFFKDQDCGFVDLTYNQDRYGRSRQFWSDPDVCVRKEDALIVGGGGLVGYADTWHEAVNSLASKAGKAVGWGFGRNFAGEDRTKVKLDLGRFGLLGTRDFREPLGGRYVPCPSCMHPQLRKGRNPKRRRGIVLHKDGTFHAGEDRRGLVDGADFACNAMGAGRLIEFISECEEVWSNSYHACYWAALLDVPARNLGESANRKFLDAKFDYHGGSNAGFYDECVRLTKQFSLEVRKLILGY